MANIPVETPGANNAAFVEMAEALESRLVFGRVNINNVNFSASFRDDGTGNLGWYVGAAGAADGSQLKVASVNKANSAAIFNSLHSGSSSAIMGSASASFQAGAYVHGAGGAYWHTYNSVAPANERVWRFGCVGSNLVFQGVNDIYSAVTVAAMVLNRNGNVGIGTSTPGAELEVADSAGDNDCRLRIRANATHFITHGCSATQGFIDCGNDKAFVVLTQGANRFVIDATTGHTRPGADNTQTLGTASFRWSVVYAGTGTINTSDAREKTAVRAFNAAELRAALKLASEIGVFRWLDAVAEKGDAARQHVGMTVQRAIEIMEGEGLDPWAYGFMCRDEITRRVKTTEKRMTQKVEEVEVEFTEIEVRDGVPVQVVKTRTEKQPVIEMVAVVDENGEPVIQDDKPLLHPVPVMIEADVEIDTEEPAGDRLGFRPDQLDRFIMRGLAAKLDEVAGV